MLITAILAQIALMTVVPLGIMIAARRALGTTWSLLVIGASTFVVSQIVRWPFLWLLTKAAEGVSIPPGPMAWVPAVNIAVLCLTSGIFEEGARYIGYRIAVPTARRWEDGVTYGLGHGGAETIILGAVVASTLVAMLSLRGVDISALPPGLDPLTSAGILLQAQRYWSMPSYLPLLGGVERLFAMCFHVAMALFVLRAVVTGRVILLLLAMALHAGLNGVAVLTNYALGPVAAEMFLAIVAAFCIWMTIRARPS